MWRLIDALALEVPNQRHLLFRQTSLSYTHDISASLDCGALVLLGCKLRKLLLVVRITQIAFTQSAASTS